MMTVISFSLCTLSAALSNEAVCVITGQTATFRQCKYHFLFFPEYIVLLQYVSCFYYSLVAAEIPLMITVVLPVVKQLQLFCIIEHCFICAVPVMNIEL
jgi:hypothetical protein